ncbi:conserved exported hypothetical protein [Gammaproteobacteria bacterium]
MKLKPVVASLIMLGLMAPAFAMDKAKDVLAQQAVLDQNSPVNKVCSEGWFNRVTVGGMANVVGIMGNHDLPGAFTTTGSGSDLYVNNANLLVDAALSKWSKASLNLAYLGAPTAFNMISDGATLNNYTVNHQVYVDEVYVTFADFAKYPAYAKIGKTYVPFGEYNDPYVLWQIESPAQMISQANGPTAIVGVASDFGFYASVFALKGDTYPQGSTTNNIRNFGAKIGYKDNLAHFASPDTSVNLNVSYLRNMWDSVFFTTNTSSPSGLTGGNANAPARDPVGALAVHFDMSYKSLSVYADWAGALKNMASTYYTNVGDAATLTYANSSRFWGANVNAAYAFETLDHDSSLAAGVQFSGNGQWFNTSTAGASVNPNVNGVSYNANANGGLFDYIIPKWRAIGEYKVNLVKHTDLSLVYAYSKSYDFAVTGNNARSTNIGLARLGVRF